MRTPPDRLRRLTGSRQGGMRWRESGVDEALFGEQLPAAQGYKI
jgi:hypothetical protein